MNDDFADIVLGAQSRDIEATPEEREDGDNVEMPRIGFGFDRRDYGCGNCLT